MGWGSETAFGVRVVLDEHGGDKEKRHEQLWWELKHRLNAAVVEVLADPKYAEISPEIY